MTLVERLRGWAEATGYPIGNEGADRIRDLEAALQRIIRMAKDPDHDLILRLRFIVSIARTAKEERK